MLYCVPLHTYISRVTPIDGMTSELVCYSKPWLSCPWLSIQHSAGSNLWCFIWEEVTYKWLHTGKVTQKYTYNLSTKEAEAENCCECEDILSQKKKKKIKKGIYLPPGLHTGTSYQGCRERACSLQSKVGLGDWSGQGRSVTYQSRRTWLSFLSNISRRQGSEFFPKDWVLYLCLNPLVSILRLSLHRTSPGL